MSRFRASADSRVTLSFVNRSVTIVRLVPTLSVD